MKYIHQISNFHNIFSCDKSGSREMKTMCQIPNIFMSFSILSSTVSPTSKRELDGKIDSYY